MSVASQFFERRHHEVVVVVDVLLFSEQHKECLSLGSLVLARSLSASLSATLRLEQALLFMLEKRRPNAF